jgi:hypothetical protein
MAALAEGGVRSAGDVLSYPSLPADWDALLPPDPRPLSTRPWLESLRGGLQGEIRTFVLRRGGVARLGIFGLVVNDPAAYAALNLRQLLSGETSVFDVAEEDALLVHRLREEARAPALWFPNLVLVYPGYECFPVGPGAVSDDEVEGLVEGVAAWARRRALRAIGFLYSDPENSALERVLETRGCARVDLGRRGELSLEPFTSFDDYLAWLPSNRRSDYHRESGELARRGVVTTLDDPRRWRREIVEERCALLRRYGHPADERYEADRLDAILDRLADRIVFFRALRGDEFVGYSIILSSGSTWHTLWTGSRYSPRELPFVYFATMFHAPIRAAIESGVRNLCLGVGTERAKLERGARMVPTRAWLLPLDGELARIALQPPELSS